MTISQCFVACVLSAWFAGVACMCIRSGSWLSLIALAVMFEIYARRVWPQIR